MTIRTVLFLLLLVPASQLMAQGDGPPGPPGRPSERLEQLRKVRMIEMLDLKEDQSVRFFARMNDHENARRALRKERNDILDKLERLVRNRADDAEYEPLFHDVAAVDQKLWDEARSFGEGLRDILTTEQRAKLVLFERRFEGELREAMREARHRRMGEQPDR